MLRNQKKNVYKLLSRSRKCPSYLEVCCGFKQIIEEEVTNETPEPKTTNTTKMVTSINDEMLREDTVSIDGKDISILVSNFIQHIAG